MVSRSQNDGNSTGYLLCLTLNTLFARRMLPELDRSRLRQGCAMRNPYCPPKNP